MAGFVETMVIRFVVPAVEAAVLAQAGPLAKLILPVIIEAIAAEFVKLSPTLVKAVVEAVVKSSFTVADKAVDIIPGQLDNQVLKVVEDVLRGFLR